MALPSLREYLLRMCECFLSLVLEKTFVCENVKWFIVNPFYCKNLWNTSHMSICMEMGCFILCLHICGVQQWTWKFRPPFDSPPKWGSIPWGLKEREIHEREWRKKWDKGERKCSTNTIPSHTAHQRINIHARTHARTHTHTHVHKRTPALTTRVHTHQGPLSLSEYPAFFLSSADGSAIGLRSHPVW